MLPGRPFLSRQYFGLDASSGYRHRLELDLEFFLDDSHDPRNDMLEKLLALLA